jgi:hypothetical protein
MTNILIDPGRVAGLPIVEQVKLQKLVDVYTNYQMKNAQKERYYEGKVTLGEVNLGIALPHNMRGLEIGCSWGAKTVDVLAARSMFDGFVGTNGEADRRNGWQRRKIRSQCRIQNTKEAKSSAPQ